MNRYKIEITGNFTKYLLKKLVKEKISLYYIKEENKKLTIIIDKKDYKKLLKMKTKSNIKIINRYGLSKMKYLIIKYRYFLLSFFVSLFLLITLSNIIFEVEVIHGKEEIREKLLEDLKELGITKYHPVVTYSKKEQIKKKIMQKEKETIEWLEIDRIGTKYIVHVEEKKQKNTKIDNNPRDIVAKKDAMILSLEAEEGEIVKKKYDYVKKGDTIISGTIMNKEREVKKVKAKGKVYGEVWYKVEVEIPKNYQEETLTGEKKKVLSLIFLKKEYSLEWKHYKNYSFDEKSLIHNPLLPIKLVILEKKEVKKKENTYNIKNIDKKALSLAKKKFKKNDIIYEKVLKKTMNKSTIIVDIFFKIKEDVTSYREIKDLNLREDVEKDE